MCRMRPSHSRARRGGGLERSFSWTGRSRLQFVLRRWPIDYRPTKQSLFQSASYRCGTVAGGDTGRPPAEYGGKTSLVIVATTRSGVGVTQPHGDVTASYGTFGSSNEAFNLAYGDRKSTRLNSSHL